MTFQQKGPWSKKTYVSWISNAILCDIWKKLPIPAHYFSFFHLEWHQWPPLKILRCVALAFNPYRFVRFHGQYNLASTIWRSSRIWLKNMSLLACGWFHAEYFQLSPWFKNPPKIGQAFSEFSWRGRPFQGLELVVKLGFTFTAVMLTLVASLVWKKKEKTLTHLTWLIHTSVLPSNWNLGKNVVITV